MQDPLSGVDPISIMNYTLDEAKFKDNEPLQNIHVVCLDEGKAELGPWLTRTEWKDTFQGKDMSELVSFYHWTLLRRPLRAGTPSIILYAFHWRTQAPQRRGSPHSGEGKN